MTDLRERVLLALIDSTPGEYLPPPNAMSAQVDAVIAALALRRDPITPQVAALLYGDFRKPMHRYVTEWEDG